MTAINPPFEQSPYQLLARSAPLLILRGFVISSLQFFAKRAIYAQADESMLAAYGVYSTIEGLIFLLVFRGLRIISAKTAHLHAREMQNDPTFLPEEVGKLYRQGVLLGCVLLIPGALLCLCAPTLFRWTNQSSMVLENTSAYFGYGFLGYAADMLYRSRARIDIGRSQPGLPLIGDIVESVIDALGTYTLVNGKWGFPKMGVSGGSAAYALATVITAALYNLQSHLNSDLKKYKLYHFKLAELKNSILSDEFKEIIYGGLHIAIKFSIVFFTIGLTTFLCSQISNAAQVGLQAAIAYSSLITLPIGGFSEATSVVVGRLLKKNASSAKKIGNFTILASCIFASLCATFLFIFINPIALQFVNNDAAHQKDLTIVKTFLTLQSIMEIINSLGNTGSSALSGFLETRFPFLMSIEFIFLLNSTLTISAYFLFDQNPAILYAVQLIGLTFNSVGILLRWKNQHSSTQDTTPPSISYQTTRSIWGNYSTESPINTDCNEPLPGNCDAVPIQPLSCVVST